MSVLERLRSEILPKAVKANKFGENVVKFLEFKSDENYYAAEQFASSIYFGDVILATRDGSHMPQSVVVKAQQGGKLGETDAFGFNVWLSNEILFYNEILPLLDQCDSSCTVSKIFPKCFYAHIVEDDPSQDLLIFENVQKKGFKMSPWKAFNDYAHIKLSLEWLGKFHATSLLCKQKFPDKFKQIISKISESHWTEERLSRTDGFFRENNKRGILPLKNDPKYSDKLENLQALVEETDLTMSKLVTPQEPLSVICHGDFCRNNIFYKYDSNGEPCEVIFFDMATIRYSSPVIDLSFYVYMNSSPEVRSDHWSEMLRTYHSALTSNPELDPRGTPSFEDFQLDFQRRGFYGYTHASFYLPMMLTDKDIKSEDWTNMRDVIKMRLETGGEVATEYVVKLVKFMIDQNFDFRYIKNLKIDILRNR